MRYQRPDITTINKWANARSGGFDRLIKEQYKQYKVKEGKNRIRILPNLVEDSDHHYAYETYVNYRIGVDKQSYLSLSKMGKGADPIAEARLQAERAGESELAKDLAPNKRATIWLIDRLAEEEGPQLWIAPLGVIKDFQNISFDDETKACVYVDDPDQGCDIVFYMEKKPPPKYAEYPGAKMKLMQPSKLHADNGQAQEWMDYINENPIPECLNFYSYEHIANVYNGATAKPAADGDDEDETPPPKTKIGRAELKDGDDEPPFEAEQPRKPARTQAAESESAVDAIRERLARRRTVSTKPPADDDE